MNKSFLLTFVAGIILIGVFLFFNLQEEAQEKPFTGELIVNNVFVEELDISIMESFPVQIAVTAKGSIPDPCTEIYDIKQSRDETDFYINISSAKPIDAQCELNEKKFEEVISLDVVGLEAGTYTVHVNNQTTDFTLDRDNTLESIDRQ